MSFSNILVRATNWVGDAVMSLPALTAIRKRFPLARITVVAKPWVADLYAREGFADEVIRYSATTWRQKVRFAMGLRERGFDTAILLQNAFDAAFMAFAAGIPTRIGYSKDGRRLLLARAVRLPRKGEIPRHERFYYLEMLRRAGILTGPLECDCIRLEGSAGAAVEGRRRFEESGIGGFGSHVATFLARNGLLDGKLKFRPLMIPDTFTEQASQADMYAAAGLDRAGIVATVLATLGIPEPRVVTGGDKLR